MAPLQRLPRRSGGSPSSVFRATTDRTDYRHVAWLISTVVCLTTTKYLLVDRNFHYPWWLLSWHLLVATVLGLWRCLLRREDEPLSESSGGRPWLGGTRLAPISTSARWKTTEAFGLVAGNVLAIQGLLHFPNFTTALMLSPFAFLVEMTLLATINHGSRRPILWLHMIAATLAVVLLLTEEYRLIPNGLLFMIPAYGGFGVVRYTRGVLQKRGDVKHTGPKPTHPIPLFIQCILVAALAVLCEPSPRQSAILSNALPLVVNITAGAVAIHHGSSAFFDLEKNSSITFDCNQPCLPGKSAVANMVAITGQAALMYRLMGSSTSRILTCLQFIAYAAANFSVLSKEDVLGAVSCYLPFSKPSIAIVSEHLNFGMAYGAHDSARAVSSEGKGADFELSEVDSAFALDFAEAVETIPQEMLHILAQGATLLCWMLLLFNMVFDGRDKLPSSIDLRTDISHDVQGALDVVVSMYDERLDDVADIIASILRLPNVEKDAPSLRVIVYNKFEHADPDLLADELEDKLGRQVEVVTRPNVGRESETYLHHIVSRWDDLAARTIFLQAHVHNRWEFLRRIEDYYVPETGFLSLSFVGNVCQDCGSCSDRNGWADRSGMVEQIYARAKGNASSSCGPLLLSYKGQFVASAVRIRSVEKILYEDLLDAFVNEEHPVHKQEYLDAVGSRKHDSMSAPVFGYTMERLWNTLFLCNDMSVAIRCPSLLSGTAGLRRGGAVGDCQCLDLQM